MADAPTLLRVLVTRRHWQVYETFRVQFERAAWGLAEQEGEPRLKGLTVSKRQFERWYSGELRTKPYPDQCRVLETMFGYPVRVLLAPPEQTEDHGAHVLLPTPGPELGDWERQVAMAARRAVRFSSMVEGAGFGPETLTQLHEEVARLAADYPRLSLQALLGDLIESQDLTFRLLEERQVKPAQARDLYLLAGITSGMLAKASHDLGDPRSAMAQARTAFVCADNADHSGLRAWTRGLQSLISYWAGQPEASVRYAELGTAGQATGTTAIWLAALAARGHAALGNATAARAAITDAENARDHFTPDDLDAFGGILTFSRPRQLYYIADAATVFPAAGPDAERRAEAAVEAYRTATPEEWGYSDQAGSHADLAIAQIKRGDLDGGAEALRLVLDLPAERRVHGVLVSTRVVHATLCRPGLRDSTLARATRHEIESYLIAPAQALTGR